MTPLDSSTTAKSGLLHEYGELGAVALVVLVMIYGLKTMTPIAMRVLDILAERRSRSEAGRDDMYLPPGSPGNPGSPGKEDYHGPRKDLLDE